MKMFFLSFVLLASVSAKADVNCSRICQNGHMTASAKALFKKSYLQYVSEMGAHILFSSEPVEGCALKDIKATTPYHLCVLRDTDRGGRMISDNMRKNFGRKECLPEVYRSSLSYALNNLLSGNFDSRTGRKLEPTVGQVYETLEWVTDAWTCGQK